MEIQGKLRQVAQALELETKRFCANEKGYLTAIRISRGFSVFIRHNKNDTLTLDLTVTKTARDKDPYHVKTTVDRFNSFFGHKTRSYIWKHSLDPKMEREDFEYDVTLLSPDQIVSIIRKLRGHLLA